MLPSAMSLSKFEQQIFGLQLSTFKKDLEPSLEPV